MSTFKKGLTFISSLLLGTLFVTSFAFAQAPQQGQNSQGQGFGQGQGMWHRGPDGNGDGPHRGPGVFGTVTAVSGNTITLESPAFRGFRPDQEQNQNQSQNQGTTTYTVDASGATVYKDNATSSVGDITTGDKIMVQGTVSGTDVTATMIRDGIPPRGGRGFGPNGQGANSLIQGNGQPVVGGTIASINGSALTITNASNVTYNVDASGARVVKQGATSTLSDLASGDKVLVQGTVNGTNVTADSVIDQEAPSANANANASGQGNPGQHEGMFSHFMGAIGGFFHNLFGFF